MHTRYITISAGALLLAATSPAMAHHPSGTGTSSTGGPIVTIPGTTLQKGGSALYFVFEHISRRIKMRKQLSAESIRYDKFN